MNALVLRALEDADLPRLHLWLNEPHLRPFYRQGPTSLDQVRHRYTPRIEGHDPCRCFIAEEAARPFGYVQWYRNRDVPDYGRDIISRDFGLSIDY